MSGYDIKISLKQCLYCYSRGDIIAQIYMLQLKQCFENANSFYFLKTDEKTRQNILII